MVTRFVSHIHKAVVLLGAWRHRIHSCLLRRTSRHYRPQRAEYCVAVEVHTDGLRPLSVVTDPQRIKVAFDFIKHYEEGWKSPRWQGGVIPRRRFDFWEGDRYLGGFGINPDSLTTHNYYQEAPAEEIARIAAVFELEWPVD